MGGGAVSSKGRPLVYLLLLMRAKQKAQQQRWQKKRCVRGTFTTRYYKCRI